MKAVEGEGKSYEETRHDERGRGQCPRGCKFCRRDAAQARVDQLVAEGKLVRG